MKRITLMFDKVPEDLKREAQAKAAREGVSLRALVFRWLTNWVAGRRPDQDRRR